MEIWQTIIDIATVVAYLSALRIFVWFLTFILFYKLGMYDRKRADNLHHRRRRLVPRRAGHFRLVPHLHPLLQNRHVRLQAGLHNRTNPAAIHNARDVQQDLQSVSADRSTQSSSNNERGSNEDAKSVSTNQSKSLLSMSTPNSDEGKYAEASQSDPKRYYPVSGRQVHIVKTKKNYQDHCWVDHQVVEEYRSIRATKSLSRARPPLQVLDTRGQ
ncbi:hypothetical protein F5B22DRAFT_646114 [Xylaria bambusicola]|uniref:uncharacterized protein n=1 Tax=Xylaria bambusicola TaxID=326684 RepID=UPI002007B579|nr:uncharacterized protein F5B22DRAFT_646114 [Xylaria bambusicola]KAI0517124.1 hypothetical protein F5B22DRAFT_646114 [Xylaria bambusicola]